MHRMGKAGALITVALVAIALVLLVKGSAHTEEKTGKDASGTEQAEKDKQDPRTVDAVTKATGMPFGPDDDMQEVVDFVEKNRMGFLATVDDGMPRVRAWGFMMYEDGRFYFGTSNTKAVFDQLKDVPYAEFACMDASTYKTLRIFGEVVFVEDADLKNRIIADNPMIKSRYEGERAREFEVFYLRNIEANWFGFAMPDEDD